MGVSPALARELARQTRVVYEQATTDLIRGIARQVAAGADAADWQTRKLESMSVLRREADEVMTRLDDEVPGTVEEALTSAYRQGTRTASAEAARAGITGGFGADADREGITRLLEEALRPHRQAILQVRRGTLDAFDDAITRAAGRVLTGTGTRRDAARSALGVLADKGITGYRDASGRQWDLASYAEMATRTSAGHAAIEGHMARLVSLDADLVFVSDSPEECSICRPFEGRVLSISGKTRGRLDDGVTVLCSATEARDAGLYHPNCTHSQSIYLPGFTDLPTDTADPIDAGLREQQRAYERRVRGWKRRVELDEQVYGKQSPEAKRTRQRLRGTHAEFKAWRDKHDRRPVPGRTNLTHR